MFRSINPYTNKVLKSYKELTSTQINSSIERAEKSFQEWKRVPYSERSQYFLNLAKIIRQDKDQIATLMVLEVGKLFSEATAELEKCAVTCEYYAEKSEDFLKDEFIETDAKESYVSYEPMGVILGIMPWNFPFWQVLRFAIPTMMAGNTCILKHASNVSGCALKIQECFEKSGFPKNTFQTILVKSNKVKKILSDKRVRGVSLTGSTPAGVSVASLAGQFLKKSVLELGGSDPYIIFADADLEKAINICVKARMNNAGQTCVAAKRFIISDKIYESFKEGFVEKLKGYQIGNPLEHSTTLAPLSRHDLRDDLIKQIRKAKSKGAKVSFGGMAPRHEGAFMEPTLIERITPNNPAFHEEFFGPVALFFKVKSDTEALKIANATDFGLGAAIFSQDQERAKTMAQHELEAGFVCVNTQVRSDPRLPFGGIKQSGMGRELSHHGIKEFTNIKTVYISD